LAVPYYDRTPPELIGQPYLMGQDEYEHNVYFMGMWNKRDSVTATIRALLDYAGVERDTYILQDAFPLINFSTKLGGLISKRYRMTGFGRRITVWGMQRQYPLFVELVSSVKKQLE
jgi:hypothetical protein